jgi:hypothetical protein
MPFKVAATRSSLTGPPPVDTNVYELRVVGFKPKVAKSGTSLNYYGEFEVINNGQFDGRKVFFSLNTAFPTGIRDFVHATGNEMEKTTILNEETGQMEEAFVLPGIFENADQFPQEPEKWGAYRGPLTNATFKAEVVKSEYQGRPKNDIRAFFCTVPNCAVNDPDLKHSTNLIKS